MCIQLRNSSWKKNLILQIKYTSSRSILESISNICRASICRSLPQMSLVQTKTMKVALIPNPMIVVIRFIPESNISILLNNNARKWRLRKRNANQKAQLKNAQIKIHISSYRSLIIVKSNLYARNPISKKHHITTSFPVKSAKKVQ